MAAEFVGLWGTSHNLDRSPSSLGIPSIHSRHESMLEAYSDTFSWIFQETSPSTNFSEWLKEDNHVYRTQGISGSGKSTHMKFFAERGSDLAQTDATNGLFWHFKNLHRSESRFKVNWSPNEMRGGGIRSYEVKGTINGISVTALPDYGSAVNAVSQDFAEQHRMKIEATGTERIGLLGGHIAESIGRVAGHFKFQGESQAYHREFHVLRKSAYDMVLGKKFLDETKTLIKFCHRIIERVRPCVQKGSRLFLLDECPKDHIRSSVNGSEASAFPDTGSELMLISGDFARRNNFEVHRARKYRREVQLINGSTIRTDGMVLDAELQFDAPPVLSKELDYNQYLGFAAGLSSVVGNGAKSTFICDFHVIEDLPCDIVLSNEFIFQNQVFSRFGGLFYSRPTNISLEAEKMLDNGLLFMRITHKRSSWFFRRRRRSQRETDTIPLQDNPTWEDRWKIEEARRNRNQLWITSIPEPQKSVEQRNEDQRQVIWDRDNMRPPSMARLRSSDPNLRRTLVPRSERR
ncbi:uncharacterized protein PAC_17856 [Phialocephala subalpina]|uniref:Uncharacterized protein n=1 Tax=Phialocephala subalpina TaxID=576137 RepID=A0A1L7XSL2_9HELO|nr:uncharacterized protein PAC_17856 [Phialocephala subalpina]